MRSYTNIGAGFATDRNVGREANRAQGTGIEEAGAGAGGRGRGRGRGGPRRGGDRHSRAGQPKYDHLHLTIRMTDTFKRTSEASRRIMGREHW